MWRDGLRELWFYRRFSLLFVFNMTLGYSGFLALDAFKNSFRASLDQTSRALLTADISIAARRPLTEREEGVVRNALVGEPHTEVQTISTYTMAWVDKRSRLVELRAVSRGHPLIGSMTLEEKGRVGTTEALHGHAVAWAYPELFSQLGLKIGDTIQVGTRSFALVDKVVDDPGLQFSGVSFAPRIYIAIDQIEGTKLLQKGSSAYYTKLIRLDSPNPALPADEWSQRFDSLLPDPAIRIRSHTSQGDNSSRMLHYLADYLGLVGLIALFLATLGTTYLYRGFLQDKKRDIAVLLSLGRGHGRVVSSYALQLSFLSTLSAVLAAVLATAVLPVVTSVLDGFTPVRLGTDANWQTFAVAIVTANAIAFAFCMPLLIRIGSISPASLLHDQQRQSLALSWRDALGYVPAVVLLFLMSLWQANSFVAAGLFFGALLAFLFVTALFASLLLRSGRRLIESRSLSLAMALRNLARNRVETLSGFTAIGMGVLLVLTVAFIRSSIEGEIQFPENQPLPSLFLFDIQPEQVAGVESLIRSTGNDTRTISPLIRSRLLSINDVPFVKPDQDDDDGFETREEQRERLSRNRGYNLSYRSQLAGSEEIIDGRPFSGVYDPAGSRDAEISVERRFAARLGIQVGDKLVFDIVGVPVAGQVVNLRKVRWTSFDPNFFIQFQPGVLDEAPKTFLASVPPLNGISPDEMTLKITQAFPNVSIIDVRRLVAKIVDTVSSMVFILQAMAILALVVGMLVIYSIARHQSQRRLWDVGLLKAMGTEFSVIERSIWFEYGVLAAAAAGWGILWALGIAWTFSHLVFDAGFTVAPLLPGVAQVGVPIVTALVCLAATKRALAVSPRALLAEAGM